MRQFDIENIRSFTSKLFAGDAFDGFQAVESLFVTSATYTIDGHLNPEFLGEEEMKQSQNQDGLILWSKVKPIAYEIIKGKKVPQQFKIIFRYPSDKTTALIQEGGIPINPAQVSGLFLNVLFKGGKISCTTGTALKSFTMDKSLEHRWDDYMEQFLKQF